MIATLYGARAEPLMAAVAVVVMVIGLTPTSAANINGTVTVCRTTMPL
jgi:hypothetical protein